MEASSTIPSACRAPG